MQTMKRDMTTGNPAKIIVNFTMPIFIGNIFQQFYSMADTIIVGKFVGNAALAAVGSCGTLVFLIIGFLQGLTAGFTVITAQHFGAGNMRAMRQSVVTASVLSAYIYLMSHLRSFSPIRSRRLFLGLGRIFLIVHLVCLDYLLNKLVADDIGTGELANRDIVDTLKHLHCDLEAADLIIWQVYLRYIAGYDHL